MTESVGTNTPDRNLAMELVRVTEAAAMAAARWMGRGDKEGADGAAVDAMRVVLSTVSMDGIVVIGEGEKDEAPMLFNGERIGTGEPPSTDIAVDPVDGTTLTAQGQGNAIAVIAVSERGTMFNPGPCVYMEKIAAGFEAADVIDITRTPTENLEAIAKAKHEKVRDLTGPGLTDPVTQTSSPRCGHPERASGSSPMVMWPAPSRRRGPSPAPMSFSASAVRRRA
ncbi:MAG: hypothetical protein NVSMB16_04650 [Acidimicrobiales bacterium]